MRSIATTSAIVALVAAIVFLQPICGHEAAAQSTPLHIHAIDIDVVPGQIDNYLAALKENGAASVREPGCREFDITVSQKDPNHVFILEVYDSADAAQAIAKPNISRSMRRRPRTWSPSASSSPSLQSQ